MASLRAALFAVAAALVLSTTDARGLLRVRSPSDAEPQEIVPNDNVANTDSDEDQDRTTEHMASPLHATEGAEDDDDDDSTDAPDGAVTLFNDNVDEVMDDEEAERGYPIEEDSQPQAKTGVKPVSVKADAQKSQTPESLDVNEPEEDSVVEEGMEKVTDSNVNNGGVYNPISNTIESNTALIQVGRNSKTGKIDSDEDDNEAVDDEDESGDSQETGEENAESDDTEEVETELDEDDNQLVNGEDDSDNTQDEEEATSDDAEAAEDQEEEVDTEADDAADQEEETVDEADDSE